MRKSSALFKVQGWIDNYFSFIVYMRRLQLFFTWSLWRQSNLRDIFSHNISCYWPQKGKIFHSPYLKWMNGWSKCPSSFSLEKNNYNDSKQYCNSNRCYYHNHNCCYVSRFELWIGWCSNFFLEKYNNYYSVK